MAFRIGQKVVCVNDDSHTQGGSTLRSGNIYTVTGFGETCFGNPTIFVAEAHYTNGTQDPGFYQTRFRPVVEKKTDISIFTAMLKTERQPILTD